MISPEIFGTCKRTPARGVPTPTRMKGPCHSQCLHSSMMPITDRCRVTLAAARVSAVISSAISGVSAVAAAGVLCAFSAWWARYLDSVPAAEPEQIPLSLLFLELSGYYVDAVQLSTFAVRRLPRPRPGGRREFLRGQAGGAPLGEIARRSGTAAA